VIKYRIPIRNRKETLMADRFNGKKLTNLEISAFADQMAMMLGAGISSLESLTILQEGAQNQRDKQLYTFLKEEMATGLTLHSAAADSGAFPEYMVKMIRLGEETGTLDKVMTSLDIHYTREDNISSTIRSALTYPLIMIVIMLMIVVVLVTKVLPIFNQVFTQLGQEMTGFSSGLLHIGQVLSKYAVVFVVLAALIVAFGIFLGKTAKGRGILVKLGYKFSYTREIYEKTAACRFADGMFLALSSGLSPESSIELAGDLSHDPFFAKKLDQCKALINGGMDLSNALHESHIFTGLYSQIVSIASKSGNMDDVMSRVASDYERNVDTKISTLIATLEPTLVIILAIIVGVILFSVMLPLLGVMAGL
jgi:type IV pilus assembly protein PilC